jgi:hypothetical protein
MARGRTGAVLLVLALAAISVGTVATLLTKGGPGRRTSPVRRVDEPARAGPATPVRASSTRREGNLWVRVLLQPEGTPVAGAEVLFQDHEGVWAADTDAAGEANFPARKGTPVLLRARAKGLLGATVAATVMQEQEAPFLLHVSRIAGLEGTVRVRATRAAVEGARVRVTENEIVLQPWWSMQPAPELAGEKRETVTDAAGRFRVEGLAGGAGCVVTADREGFAAAKVHAVPASPEPGGLEILLDPGTRVRGTARDRAGQPVDGVRVVLGDETRVVTTRPGWPGVEVRHRRMRFPAERGPDGVVTGADGAYAFDGRPGGGVYSLHAEKDGWSVVEGPGRVSLPETGGDVVRDLLLERSGVVLLDWTAAVGDAPGAATVEIRPLADGEAPWALLRFPRAGRLTGLTPGRYRFTVTDEVAGAGEQEADVGGGGETQVTVHLGPGAGIEGEVVDPHGAPLAGALVRLMVPGDPPRQADHGWRGTAVDGQGASILEWSPGIAPSDRNITLGARAFARTDAAGRFRFAALRAGSAWGLRVELQDYATALVEGVAVPASGLRIALARSGGVHGRLLLPPGSAAPRTMSIYHREGKPAPGDASPGGIRSTVMFGDGTFSVAGLPPGPGTLHFRTEDPPLFASVEVDISSGGHVQAGDVALRRGVTIRGRVVDAAKAPVPGADVYLNSNAGTTSGRDGTFTFRDVPEGPARLRAVLPRAVPGTAGTNGAPAVAAFDAVVRDFVDAGAWVTVTNEAADVELAFPPHGLLRGTLPAALLSDPRTRRLVRCVRADAGRDDPGWRLIAYSGRILARVPAGTWRVEVFARDGDVEPWTTGEAVVPDGGEAVVEWKERR